MESEINHSAIAPTGRNKRYRRDKANHLPFSCILRVYKNDLGSFLGLLAQDLKAGAGIKVPLDEFEKRTLCKVNWGFYLDPSHPDFQNITDEQRKLLCDPRYGRVFTVSDSLLGDCGIQASWHFLVNHAIESEKAGNKLIFDLSNLRPAGTVNKSGLEASGPVGRNGESSFLSILGAIAHHLEDGTIISFVKLLGTLNACIRQGGLKRGIICTSLRWDSPYISDYLSIFKTPGGHKKAVRLTHEVLENTSLLEEIANSCEIEGTFLEKVKSPTLYANVCQGIAIEDGGTCLIHRINLGKINSLSELVPTFMEATRQLVGLHCTWREEVEPHRAAQVAPLERDRQVALDLMGLASFFAKEGLTYAEVNEALKRLVNDTNVSQPTKADDFVYELELAYRFSTFVAEDVCQQLQTPQLERIHTIEPCQRHFIDCTDTEGFTTTRGVYPPYHTTILRSSDSEEQKLYHFNPNVETADQVGPELWQEFFCNLKRLIDIAGRSHGYASFDSYKPITPDWIRWFIEESPLDSLYYPEAQRFQQTYLQKKVEVLDLGIRSDECEVCSE